MDKNYFVDGNTVREMPAQPLPRPRERRKSREELRRIKRRKSRRNAARRNRERAMFMSRGQVFFLSLCVFASVVVTAGYIKAQSQLSHRMKEVAALKSQITDLKADNDTRYKSISTSVDLEHVKEVAINELGMSYAKKEQIVHYSVDKNNFMDQYQDIPE